MIIVLQYVHYDETITSSHIHTLFKTLDGGHGTNTKEISYIHYYLRTKSRGSIISFKNNNFNLIETLNNMPCIYYQGHRIRPMKDNKIKDRKLKVYSLTNLETH